MHKLLAILVICTILSVGCGVLATPIATPAPGYYPDLSVKIAWTNSFSLRCSSSEIDGNGNVTSASSSMTFSDGRLSGGVTMTQIGRITPQQVEELVAAIKRSDVWTMEDEYSGSFCSDCLMTDLTISLNGQSKHVEIYDAAGSCGSQRLPMMIFGGVPRDSLPPEAFCQLDDTIRTIVNSTQWLYVTPNAIWTFSPAPSPMATHPPPPTPPPTPTLPAIMRTGDFGIVSQEPCGPPCLWGIRPGITTFDDAVLMLKNAGFPCSVKEVTQGKFLTCGSSDTYISVSNIGFCTMDSGGIKVTRIALAPPVKITVGEFVAQYGPPDWVAVAGSQVTVSYENLQTFLWLAMQPSQPKSYTVTPGTTNDVIVYVTAAEYPKCVGTVAHGRQPWKGYGTYTLQP